MSWIGLSILAALVWSVVNVLDKLTLTKWPIPPILLVILMSIIGLIASIGIFIFYPVHFLPFPLMIWAFLAGASYFATTYLYFYAVKWENVSRVIPLLYLTPLWIALIAHFFLDEHLRSTQYWGISLLIAGAVLISVKKFQTFHLNKALLAVVLSCLCFAINQVITKYLLQHTDVLTTFAYVRFSTFLATLPLLLLNLRSFYRVYKENGIQPFLLDTASQGLNITGLFIFVSATSIGYVTLTNALVAIQPLFVLLLVAGISHFYPTLYKETFDKKTFLKNILSIIFMFSGILLLQ
jgi:drug/metabolite transporter (DMT)-like permease